MRTETTETATKKQPRLTKSVRATLENALRNAQRARRLIHDDNYAFCRRQSTASTTLHYVRPSDGAALYEIERSHGSDLVGLDNAIAELRSLLGGAN